MAWGAGPIWVLGVGRFPSWLAPGGAGRVACGMGAPPMGVEGQREKKWAIQIPDCR